MKDWNYSRIIRTKNREKMYKYKLIMLIINDLDKYLMENDIVITNDETMLSRYIDRLYNNHCHILLKYFTLFGGPKIKCKIDIKDIEEWTYKYKKKNRLFYYDEKLVYGKYK